MPWYSLTEEQRLKCRENAKRKRWKEQQLINMMKPRRESDIAAWRRCLGCGRKFWSQWSGQRQCRSCKSREIYVLGSDFRDL